MYSSDDPVRVYQNCKFHDTQGRDSCAGACPYLLYRENALFLLKYSLLLRGIEQTKLVYRYDVPGSSTKIVNIMTPGTGSSLLGRGHISRIVK